MKSILITMLYLIGSNVFAQSNIVKMVSNITSLRLEAEAALASTPYRANEHQIIKNYFSGIKDFAAQISENSRMNRRFNNYLEEEGMAKFCSEFFINLKDWEQIKLNCTRNRYFLCTEDVNDYPESKTSLSKILSEELLKIFVDTTECK